VDPSLAITFIDGCIGWLGGLTLIVVGGLVVRQADIGAGLVLAAAGGLKLLLNCCVLAPNLVYQFGSFDIDPSVFDTNLVLVQLQRLAFFGLLAAGLTRLGKAPEAKP